MGDFDLSLLSIDSNFSGSTSASPDEKKPKAEYPGIDFEGKVLSPVPNLLLRVNGTFFEKSGWKFLASVEGLWGSRAGRLTQAEEVRSEKVNWFDLPQVLLKLEKGRRYVLTLGRDICPYSLDDLHPAKNKSLFLSKIFDNTPITHAGLFGQVNFGPALSLKLALTGGGDKLYNHRGVPTGFVSFSGDPGDHFSFAINGTVGPKGDNDLGLRIYLDLIAKLKTDSWVELDLNGALRMEEGDRGWQKAWWGTADLIVRIPVPAIPLMATVRMDYEQGLINYGNTDFPQDLDLRDLSLGLSFFASVPQEQIASVFHKKIGALRAGLGFREDLDLTGHHFYGTGHSRETLLLQISWLYEGK